jgi:hypothetical protein
MVTSRAGIIREWIMPFVSSTLKSSEKWWSPLFGATGNFNHQILPYSILFLTFWWSIHANVIVLFCFLSFLLVDPCWCDSSVLFPVIFVGWSMLMWYFCFVSCHFLYFKASTINFYCLQETKQNYHINMDQPMW